MGGTSSPKPKRAGSETEWMEGMIYALLQRFTNFEEIEVPIKAGTTIGWVLIHEALKRGHNLRLSHLPDPTIQAQAIRIWANKHKGEYPILQNVRIASDMDSGTLIVYFVPWKDSI